MLLPVRYHRFSPMPPTNASMIEIRIWCTSEDLGVPYRIVPVHIGRGDQRV